MTHEAISERYDKIGNNPRLILEQEEVKTEGISSTKGVIFIAEFSPADNDIHTMWKTSKNPLEFITIAKSVYGEGIAWKRINKKSLRGAVGEFDLGSDLNIRRAVALLDISMSSNTDDSLKKITEFAFKTVMDGILLPQNLHGKLKEFASRNK